MIKNRIAILDGFRAMAILSVALFHFFSRWTAPKSEIELYPYTNSYDFFNYGYLGVHFFFIISGFVIFFTLDNTEYFSSFWKKRLIRLWPSMVIASIITYIVFRIFDTHVFIKNSHEAINFIPSLTFIKPELFNYILPNKSIHLDYLSSSYWSLWPEIQFYFLSSVIYYFNRSKFLRNFLIASILIVLVNYLFQHVQGSNKLHIHLPAEALEFYIKWFQEGFNIVSYLHYFCLGVLYYSFFKNKQHNTKTKAFVKFCFLFVALYMIYAGGPLPIRLIFLSMLLLFFAFIYAPEKLSFLEKKVFTSIGESSYFLYLIHENIGVLLIYSVAGYFLPFGFVFTILMIIGQILLCHLYTVYLDRKITGWLKRKILS